MKAYVYTIYAYNYIKHSFMFSKTSVSLLFRKNCIYKSLNQSNPYEVLGVKSTDSPVYIKQVYKKLVLKYHPDSVTGSKDKFQEIQAAYKILERNNFNPLNNEDYSASPNSYTDISNPEYQKKNYVKGREKAILRLFLIYSFIFFIVKYAVSTIFKNKKLIIPIPNSQNNNSSIKVNDQNNNSSIKVNGQNNNSSIKVNGQNNNSSIKVNDHSYTHDETLTINSPVILNEN